MAHVRLESNQIERDNKNVTKWIPVHVILIILLLYFRGQLMLAVGFIANHNLTLFSNLNLKIHQLILMSAIFWGRSILSVYICVCVGVFTYLCVWCTCMYFSLFVSHVFVVFLNDSVKTVQIMCF